MQQVGRRCVFIVTPGSNGAADVSNTSNTLVEDTVSSSFTQHSTPTEPSLNNKLELIAVTLQSIKQTQSTMMTRIEQLETPNQMKHSSETSI